MLTSAILGAPKILSLSEVRVLYVLFVGCTKLMMFVKRIVVTSGSEPCTSLLLALSIMYSWYTLMMKMKVEAGSSNFFYQEIAFPKISRVKQFF